jgi:hypothetical protein
MLENIRNRHIAEVYTYWRSLAPSNALPAKSSFDPIGLPPAALPRVFMIDNLVGSSNYRLRLLGSYLVNAYDRDFTGHDLIDSQIPNVTRSRTFRLLNEMLSTRLPQYDIGPTVFRFNDRYTTVEQVLLPLTDEAGCIAFAVGAVDYPDYSP